MSLLAEFTLRSPELVPAHALETVPRAHVELEQQIAATHRSPLLMIWVSVGAFSAFDDALDSDPTVESHSVAEDFAERKLYRLALERENVLEIHPVYQRVGAVPLAGERNDGGWWRRVRFPAETPSSSSGSSAPTRPSNSRSADCTRRTEPAVAPSSA